ncbi:hypothetical protein [Cellulosilyticum lentocellum]|uniref:Uncharacterized protein n=1 Tax=Cellulosilyticum lentocellum (strain ATCC 49066 / DSM 5427 / NCIMB 11756 / RHM5) TaxID=642492 RepID=F2JJ48_CELLD|nr:hypothetical protein [Cellulosilyticum lentocellum]ADZ83207.1 hypothetical protein Clole_1481 [Cellulosilyticum lentocellum DSM 5427]
METNELISKTVEVLKELPDQKIDYEKVEAFLNNENVTEEQKDLFRLFIRIEKSRRQVAC